MINRRAFLALALLIPACAQRVPCPLHEKGSGAFAQKHPIHDVVSISPDQEQRYYSADSGSGHMLGYERGTNRPIYGSGKPARK